jgi:hypothetical protein
VSAAVFAFIPAFWFFYVRERRLIVIECPSCGKDINTNTPWECGYKGCRNENVDEYPFIRECEVCHYIPKAYVCHHHDCQRLIYLTSDRQQLYAAKQLNPAPPPVKKEPIVKDVIGEKIVKQKEEVRDLEHDLKKTTIQKQIEIVKNKPIVPPPATTEAQTIIERVRKGVNNGKTLIDLERQLMDEARAAYPNNPDELESMERVIREIIFNERERRPGG